MPDALDLLSGDAQTFIDKVWARRTQMHQADPGRLTGYLSLADVDTLLTSSGLRTPALRVVQDGDVLPAARFTRQATLAGQPLTGLVDARKVLDLHRGGATVVLQGLHRYWAPLTELVRDLDVALGHPCQANAYLTPPGSQGFATHSDTHDVFVFQTHGSKRWTIDGDEVVLRPGSVAYLPTGTPHSARSEAETSLHVTIGINQVTWRDALRRAVDEILADARYEEHLPAGYLHDAGRLSDAFAEQADTLAKAISALCPVEYADEAAERFLTSRPPHVAGGLTDLQHLGAEDGIVSTTRVVRRAGAVLVPRPHGDRIKLLLGDRALVVPGRLEAAVRFIADTPSFSVDEVPLDDASSRVLVRRLIREGALRVAD